MSGPALPLTNAGSGYTIVTHVINPQSGSSEAQQTISSAGHLQKFLKGEPKALGTVQIMIGVLMFLFGIVTTGSIEDIAITVYSGIFFWGSLMYIITGSLAVSASRKLHRCVVKGALMMNVFSTITAGLAIIFLSLDLAFMRSCYHDYGGYICHPTDQSSGIAGVLLVFSILQFIISIFTAAYACHASCHSEPTVNITVVQNQEGCKSVVNPFPTQNNQQWMYGASVATACSVPMESPPEYSETTKCPPDN